MNNNNVTNIGYNETDLKTKVNIYGLEFEVKKIDYDKLKNIGTSQEAFEKELNEILGDGAVDKINDKRVSDGYEKMDLMVETAIFSCIFKAYTKTMGDNAVNSIDNVNNSIENMNNRLNNYNNRNQRREYNKNYNNRNGQNNRYRRY